MMDRRDWVGIGDSSSWMGGWTPGAGWVDGWMDTTRHHHPGMGRSAIIETAVRAKVLWIMETNTNKTQRHHLLLCTHNGKSKTSLIHKQPTLKYMICVPCV